jgi:hypothetical protein
MIRSTVSECPLPNKNRLKIKTKIDLPIEEKKPFPENRR